jgi:xylan 1,4-beta-xylosidase
MLTFTVDPDSPRGVLPHFWEKCVGSCHAYTALREDWRQQIAKVHREMGFQYVRFHGLFNDDMSVVTADERTGELYYCFANMDSILDFLLKIGMKPFLELSFMPAALASSDVTCFHYKGNISPPKDYAQWAQFIRLFARHLVDRYGLGEVRNWYFEVWNEPNLNYFFAGTQADYFKLYEHTARSIKEVDVRLPVGGPATAINGWIPELIAYCKQNHVPLDFISTHHYPTDDPLWKNSDIRLEELFKNLNPDSPDRYERGILQKMAVKARREAGNLPLYYTEWNSSAKLPDKIHDYPYTAALAAKTVIDNLGLVDGYSFWTFSDIFEERAQLAGEFHGGFGMQTIHGIPKPVYHTFEFLHQLGKERLSVTAEQETVGMIASAGNDDFRLVAYNHNVLDGAISAQTVRIIIAEKQIAQAEVTMVDQSHGNAYKKWEEIGAPVYPNDEELATLYQAARVSPESIRVFSEGDGSAVEFVLPAHAIAFIKLK